ncbi:MAG: ArnT family glycosyltransferase [Myxococcota bacterium]
MRAPLRIAVVLVALAIVARAWTTLAGPGDLPAFDAADYLARALRVLDGVDGELLRPDMHPPGWPFALAAWMGLVGRGFLAARVLATLLSLIAVAQLAWLGRKLDPERGALAGAIAGTLAMATGEHLRLVTAPMTEPLALVVTLGALIAAVDLPDARHPWPHLRFGLWVLAGALVRYNVAPMLIAPVVLHRLATTRRLDVAAVMWVAPVMLVFVAWEAASRGVLAEVGSFTRNLDSQLPFWRDLTWVPEALAEHYAGWPAAVAGMVAFVAALARPADPRVRLVQAWVVVAVAAIALHPYKLARTLHPVVPIGGLVVALAFARVHVRAHVLAGFAALAWVAIMLRPARMEELKKDADVFANAAAAEIVARAVRYGELGARVKVVVSGRTLAYPAVEVALRMRHLPAHVVKGSPAMNRCESGACPERLAEALEPVPDGRTVWLAIADEERMKLPKQSKPPLSTRFVPETPKRNHPSIRQAAAFEAGAEARGLTLLERYEDPEGWLVASFWGYPAGQATGF